MANFYPAGINFTITEVWPCANRVVVKNNETVIIEVLLIDVVLIEGFLYAVIHVVRKRCEGWYCVPCVRLSAVSLTVQY